jgi:hypothetical protein
VTPARRPSELLALALSVVACLVFVLGVRDARLVPGNVLKAADPIPISARDRTAALRVTVLREAGTAVAQATVQVFWEDGGRFYLAGAASSDATGSALLGALPSGRAWLLVEAPGLARASTALVLRAEPRSVRIVLHPAQTLDVTVQDETGTPIARATVLVDSADPLPFGA